MNQNWHSNGLAYLSFYLNNSFFNKRDDSPDFINETKFVLQPKRTTANLEAGPHKPIRREPSWSGPR